MKSVLIAVTIAVSVMCGFSNAIAYSDSRKMDSVYIKIVECYVPTAAFARFSENNVSFLIPTSKDTVLMHAAFKSAYSEVTAELNPEMLLKTRLGRHFVSLFNIEEAKQILSVCSAGAGFTDKDLYQRFDMFMDSFQDLFDRESDFVWLKYMGSITLKIAEKLDSQIVVQQKPKE